MKVLFDVHNLSVAPDRIIRTGIQELVFQLFKSICNESYSDIEILPVPWLPKLNYGAVDGFKAEHVIATQTVLRQTFDELGLSEDAITKRWPWFKAYLSTSISDHNKDRVFFNLLSNCDAFFEPALCDIRHIRLWMQRWKKDIKYGQHIHDLGPILYPEFVREGMTHWFGNHFVHSLRTSDFVISISRNTGIEGLDLMGDKNISKHQYYVPLPTGKTLRTENNESDKKSYHRFLQRFGVPLDADVFITLSTLEPRKNLEKTIEGFVRYQQLFPDAKPSYLILAGGRGWKSERLDRLIEESNATIITAGYVSEAELNCLLASVNGLAMLSHYEGFGIPIARARANGLPVLTAINSSLPEASALSDVFVSPYAVDEIACGFSRLLRTPPVLHDQFPTNETWSQAFAGYVDCFRNVFGDTTASAQRALDAPQFDSIPIVKRRKLALDLHNCSITAGTIRKTGIQEVVFNLLKHLPEAQKKLGRSIEIVPIASLNSAVIRKGFYPTINLNVTDYKAVCAETGFPFSNLNQYANLSFYGYSLALEHVLRECDWFVSTTQYNIEKLPHFNRISRAGTKFSFLVYDIIPTLAPEFASPPISRWFAAEYFPALKRWADLCICISRHSAIELSQNLGPSFDGKILWELLPWPKDPGDSHRHMSQKMGFNISETPYFVMIGSIDPRKNMLRVLAAFQHLRAHALPGSREANAKLVWIGATGWNHKHVLKMMKNLKNEGSLICPGYLQDSEIDTLVKHATGLLMPSRYEGYGLPLAKAASLGVTTISCVNSSLPEATLDSRTLFVNPSSNEEISLAMSRVLQSTNKDIFLPKPQTYDWSEYLCRLVEMHYSTETQL